MRARFTSRPIRVLGNRHQRPTGLRALPAAAAASAAGRRRLPCAQTLRDVTGVYQFCARCGDFTGVGAAGRKGVPSLLASHAPRPVAAAPALPPAAAAIRALHARRISRSASSTLKLAQPCIRVEAGCGVACGRGAAASTTADWRRTPPACAATTAAIAPPRKRQRGHILPDRGRSGLRCSVAPRLWLAADNDRVVGRQPQPEGRRRRRPRGAYAPALATVLASRCVRRLPSSRQMRCALRELRSPAVAHGRSTTRLRADSSVGRASD